MTSAPITPGTHPNIIRIKQLNRTKSSVINCYKRIEYGWYYSPNAQGLKITLFLTAIKKLSEFLMDSYKLLLQVTLYHTSFLLLQYIQNRAQI